jgi:predicted RNA-binding Zn-ribbon protein involved in translation (DUF1610 family)
MVGNRLKPHPASVIVIVLARSVEPAQMPAVKPTTSTNATRTPTERSITVGWKALYQGVVRSEKRECWLGGREIEMKKETEKAGNPKCPKCGAIIGHLYYWRRTINFGKYRVDGFHNLSTSSVDECYFLCPECGRILFDDMEAADKSLKGQLITENG